MLMYKFLWQCSNKFAGINSFGIKITCLKTKYHSLPDTHQVVFGRVNKQAIDSFLRNCQQWRSKAVSFSLNNPNISVHNIL